MDFKELRKEYETHGIEESTLDANPLITFRNWITTASENCPDQWFEPNAMILATAGLDGIVTSRTVLLKGLDEDSIRFYTNYGSTKGQQLAENPNASVTFHWAWLGQQVRLRGRTVKTSREDSLKYFHSRPRGSQLGALASRQSEKVESREQLEQIRAELETKYDGQEVPLPDDWGGYRLTPEVIEFWQGRLDRMHDRVVYQRGNDGDWTRFRIAP
ncbi:pyridoxamine 5'-phosphate oxidase [Mariniblastus fucicola]|uniref:Pyridoxine/pyridoxamine 5'-phosphate oxidase n=1 Tax=Mariniblastus fucicola TaxID=980251 RepID=A0A5B9P9E7_9BACT|nr:pyridoxamine 5'-phosphate oxidase [Mariniblastus fucicola]QEG21520.1 Pyridoxine/pyridoxamine 5'-phosphate oxidase [Mariniblastus fucicola]